MRRLCISVHWSGSVRVRLHPIVEIYRSFLFFLWDTSYIRSFKQDPHFHQNERGVDRRQNHGNTMSSVRIPTSSIFVDTSLPKSQMETIIMCVTHSLTTRPFFILMLVSVLSLPFFPILFSSTQSKFEFWWSFSKILSLIEWMTIFKIQQQY